MLLKTAILFLGAMVLIGMIGKALFPSTFGRITGRKADVGKPPRCRRCGRYLLGKGGCDCAKG